MKKETVKNSYIVLLTIFTAISFIIVTDRLNELEERISYIDSKRIEVENKVENLEQDDMINKMKLENILKHISYEAEDVNKDGKVDVSDLALVKSKMLKEKK